MVTKKVLGTLRTILVYERGNEFELGHLNIIVDGADDFAIRVDDNWFREFCEQVVHSYLLEKK